MSVVLCPAAMPARRAGTTLLTLPILAALAWGAGFAWFARAIRQPSPEAPRADAIVALTGGAERVETAIRLLADGRADRLLISGVPRGVDLDDLARRLPSELPLSDALAGRITLGRRASSTYGNGAETALWARENGVRSIIVVTAAYHMPRALSELGRALPGIRLYPVAVLPPPRRGTNDSGTWRMLAGEYTKWLGSEAGLGFLSRGHAAQ